MQSGLYNFKDDHESCGVAFIASLTKKPTRSIVTHAFEALLNMDHRGAVGAQENSGDGAGILVSMPDEFMRNAFLKENIILPDSGFYATGIAFASTDANKRLEQILCFEKYIASEGLELLGVRNVEVNTSDIGPSAISSMPYFMMFAIKDADNKLSGIELDRIAYRARKLTQKDSGLYFASLSSRTITYKGMLTTKQVPSFYLDLQNELFTSTIAIVHSRFSTNTSPSWELAQPLRNIAHNGEINTIKGNRNWFNAREDKFASKYLAGKNGGSIDDLFPILTQGFSDSGSFDEVLELLHLSGRDLEHAVMMMVPQAHENWDESNPNYNDSLKAFYDYASTLIEPWDGPASISFTDGSYVGSILDRNGLRPGRFWVTDELIVMASEVGVLNIDANQIIRKGRLAPGKMLLVDTVNGRIIEDSEIKSRLSNQHPYRQWLHKNTLHFDELTNRVHITYPKASIELRQRVFGYTEEELKMILTPMANTGSEPLGAMGTDTPIAVLSKRPKLLFDYFTQDFAQVTNPPLDSIREKIVASLSSAIGPEPNLLEDTESHAKKLFLPFPIIDNDKLTKIKNLDSDPSANGHFKGITIQGLFNVNDGKDSLENRLDDIFAEIDQAIERGVNFIILSDRSSNQNFAPIPSLLLTSAVQHHLLRIKKRTQISLIVESGDVRETHHAALLISYGAACVNPYLALETVENLANSNQLSVPADNAVDNLINALGNGVLKIMSKMGISTIMSYRGAQIFGAIGLSQKCIDKYFTGTTSELGGVDISDIAAGVLERHSIAYPKTLTAQPHRKLRTGGEYKWRRSGEEHSWTPKSIHYLRQATKNNDYSLFKKFADEINNNDSRNMTIRSLLEFKNASEFGKIPLNIDQVESVESIMTRFSTGAMSYGSISIEAHETLAEAMNEIGGRSNSGEGGESLDRIYSKTHNSKIKQVASGRFGVTTQYLLSATDIQIKLAQGAKPGEGGHLPGEKVYPWVATVRHSTPGIDLVSPPPHHDIYSIEDLAQLIHDLKMVNPNARIHVKLVSEYGVGTIAAGVSKCHADVVLISGHDGGTGAAPLSSIKHAGAPWELGLAQTQQTLVYNDLRDRITVQCDGQLKTGRDVIVAALLGAEEFGFATAPLIVEGCIMMRVCNKNTCPVGIATQDPYLRKNFKGNKNDVINYFRFVAQEVRELLAQLGFKSLDEAVGHVEYLKQKVSNDTKTQKIDLTNIIFPPVNMLRPDAPLIKAKEQKHGLEDSLDFKLLKQIDFNQLDINAQTISSTITNVDRSFGALISHNITKVYNQNSKKYLTNNALTINLKGVGGQSFGAFSVEGVTINLEGETNDYAAKGLSGGRIVVKPLKGNYDQHNSIIAGNVIGFGATSGVAYFAGQVGERFAVRNSGATLICEGTGDHALEYMSGGIVMILGETGVNLGSGFLGGEAYILDFDKNKVASNVLNNGVLTAVSYNDLNSDDKCRIFDLLNDYCISTSSEFAKKLIEDWDNNKMRFTKLVPTKYSQISQIKNPENNWDEIIKIIKS